MLGSVGRRLLLAVVVVALTVVAQAAIAAPNKCPSVGSAYVVVRGDSLLSGASSHVIFTGTVPAGKYVHSGSVRVANSASSVLTVGCTVVFPIILTYGSPSTETLHPLIPTVAPDSMYDVRFRPNAYELSSGTVTLTCSTSAGTPNNPGGPVVRCRPRSCSPRSPASPT